MHHRARGDGKDRSGSGVEYRIWTRGLEVVFVRMDIDSDFLTWSSRRVRKAQNFLEIMNVASIASSAYTLVGVERGIIYTQVYPTALTETS